MSELGIDVGADVDDGDGTVHSPGIYTGPPPAPPTCPNPFAIPPASILAKQIINGADKLFFISWKIGLNVREWRLIRVALRATTSSYPSCFDDGKYIVDFYTSHPSDSPMNAVNQRFLASLSFSVRPDGPMLFLRHAPHPAHRHFRGLRLASPPTSILPICQPHPLQHVYPWPVRLRHTWRLQEP